MKFSEIQKLLTKNYLVFAFFYFFKSRFHQYFLESSFFQELFTFTNACEFIPN